jgi:hypothetical protein
VVSALLGLPEGRAVILAQEQLERLFAGVLVEHFIDLQPTHVERLLGGRTIRHCPVSVGKRYPVHPAFGKPASCEVLIVGVDTTWATGWPVKLKRVTVEQVGPRYLQASGGRERGSATPGDSIARGYTHTAAKALRDAGEAIDDETLGRYSKEAQEKHTAFLEGLDSRPLHEQLAYALEGAELVGVDHRHEQMVIRRKIRALLRKIDQAA